MQLEVASTGWIAAQDWQPMVEPILEQHDGDRLIALMRRAQITDADLAEGADATVQAVGKWKRTGEFARERIPAICRTLHCSADELLGLRPIATVAEPHATYDAMDRQTLRQSIVIVERELRAAGKRIDTPEARAEIVIAVYDSLQAGAAEEVARRTVAGMLRMFAVSQPVR